MSVGYSYIAAVDTECGLLKSIGGQERLCLPAFLTRVRTRSPDLEE